MQPKYVIISAYIIQNKYVMQLHQLINNFLLNLKVEKPDETHILYIEYVYT
jgi:hypothetical protein